MRPIVTDRVAWSVGMSVCQSVTLVSPAKKAEPIEMPFGLRTRVGLRNHVLDVCLYPPWEEVGSDGSKESCVRAPDRHGKG